jgi:membrane protein YdbS with pleckstrin-like domain
VPSLDATLRELLAHPREAGTPAAEDARRLVTAYLIGLGFRVDRQRFQFHPSSLSALPVFGAGLGGLALLLIPLLISPKAPGWAAILPVFLLAWPAIRWMRRQFTKAIITGDHLRYEVGIASRSTRNIQMSKIQDVRVDQTAVQRLLDIGNLSIETAGETSRLTLLNVDKPQALADEIMARAAGSLKA